MTTERDELDAQAGEYVLGLMSDDERRQFESMLETDGEARRAVRETQQRFADLDAAVPAAAVPPQLWARIEDEIGKAGNVVPFPRGLTRIRPRSGLKFWHGFAAAAALALVTAGAFLATVSPAQPQLIVVLMDAQAQPGAIVEAFAGQRVRVVPLSRFEVPAGKSIQVWTLPNPATGPVSLGLLDGASATNLTGPVLPEPRLEQLYELTLEQAGGSPTGKPTGPVLAKGFARAPQI
ncbi:MULTISPECIES: anti-sigma factor [Rhodomicrobium]|uniref:anti-sigma factor n=1 Tax=Rhodomicrobium TaxID=1068 RepID=UPI000B4A9FFC|nr:MULTISPECIES: anti-sigma factor [Rhodomicrobium]